MNFRLTMACLITVSAAFAQQQPKPTYISGPPPRELTPNVDRHPVVSLWPKAAPGSEGRDENETYRRITGSQQAGVDDLLVIASVHHPTLTAFLPPRKIATGTGVIVAPGGGFYELQVTGEGYRIAEWLSVRGIAAFVLKYRLPNAQGSPYKIDDSVADMQRAIRTVKSRASEWNLDPERIGVIGFSAGGSLAGLAGNRFEDPVAHPVDGIDQLSARPAFEALIYGTPFKEPMPYAKKVAANTPPTFLLCGADDPISANYPQVYQMFKDAGVPVELHVFSGMGHGFAIKDSTPRAVASWPDRFWDWLFDLGMLTKR